MRHLPERLRKRLHRKLGGILFTRLMTMRNQVPVISFTFDDFPRSAALAGASILHEYGIRGTYYASFGLMGKRDSPVGEIFTEEDLAALLDAGHEVGCHTFAHSNAWAAGTAEFERSIAQNRMALQRMFPAVSLRTLSFPYSHPRLGIKRTAAKHFECCRGGGQTFNHRVVDLNLLQCYFLEKSAENVDAVRHLIDRNRSQNGWLILTTHDVCDKPSPFGCTPSFFKTIVREAVASGARVLPVSRARAIVERYPESIA
jgi:peptidoglycan/xylan/chitin deacetylase (PgdA/CDA1 family)